MIFQWFTIIFGWASIFIFIFLAAYKFYRIAILPLNLRWEVYPVPHETRDRRSYGGSYMEQVDWAKKPRFSSLLAELGEMGLEIFLLNRLRKHNPYRLWPLSLAMHMARPTMVISLLKKKWFMVSMVCMPPVRRKQQTAAPILPLYILSLARPTNPARSIRAFISGVVP